MRTLLRSNNFNSISYSYTDRQVEGIVKYSFVVGALAGGIVSLAVATVLR